MESISIHNMDTWARDFAPQKSSMVFMLNHAEIFWSHVVFGRLTMKEYSVLVTQYHFIVELHEWILCHIYSSNPFLVDPLLLLTVGRSVISDGIIYSFDVTGHFCMCPFLDSSTVFCSLE